MVEVFITIKMDRFMMVTGTLINGLAVGKCYMQMAQYMMVSGMLTKYMAKVSKYRATGIDTRATLTLV